MTSRKSTASRKGHKVVPVSTIATSEETSPLKKNIKKANKTYKYSFIVEKRNGRRNYF